MEILTVYVAASVAIYVAFRALLLWERGRSAIEMGELGDGSGSVSARYQQLRKIKSDTAEICLFALAVMAMMVSMEAPAHFVHAVGLATIGTRVLSIFVLYLPSRNRLMEQATLAVALLALAVGAYQAGKVAVKEIVVSYQAERDAAYVAALKEAETLAMAAAKETALREAEDAVRRAAAVAAEAARP